MRQAFSKSSKKKNTGRYIIGKNCIKEVWAKYPERILELYTTRSEERDPFLKKVTVPIKFVDKEYLYNLVETQSHQSIVAKVRPIEYTDLNQCIQKSKSKERSGLLLLDSIFDPQNFGALLRCAECFGVDGVIWSKNRGCDLTPVVSKASVGASELVPLVRVSNLAETVRKLKKNGYWAVSAEVGEGARPLSEFEFNEKTVIIMGSEGAGVQPILSKESDDKLFVPMQGRIDSLNVSQATSVFLYQWSSQWHTKKS